MHIDHSVLLLFQRFLDLIRERLSFGEHLGTRVDTPGSDCKQVDQYEHINEGLYGGIDSNQEIIALQQFHSFNIIS